MKKDDVKSKLKNDIYETTVKVPRNLGMEEELALLTKEKNLYFWRTASS